MALRLAQGTGVFYVDFVNDAPETTYEEAFEAFENGAMLVGRRFHGEYVSIYVLDHVSTSDIKFRPTYSQPGVPQYFTLYPTE